MTSLGDSLCLLRDAEEVTWRKEQRLLLWQRSPRSWCWLWGKAAEGLQPFLLEWNWGTRQGPLQILFPDSPAKGQDEPGWTFSSHCVKLILEANHGGNASPTTQPEPSGLDFCHKNLKNSKDQIYFLTRGAFKDHHFLYRHLSRYAELLLQFNRRPLGPMQTCRHAWLF